MDPVEPGQGFEAGLGGAADGSAGVVSGCVRPSGIVTFLFTDIEGSTRRWEAAVSHSEHGPLSAHDEHAVSCLDRLAASQADLELFVLLVGDLLKVQRGADCLCVEG